MAPPALPLWSYRLLASLLIAGFTLATMPQGRAQDLEALLSKSEANLREASPETVAAYEQLLATLQNSNVAEGYKQAQAFLARLDFLEPEQKRLASTVVKLISFRQQLTADLPQLPQLQKAQAEAEQTVGKLEARRAQLKAQYDAMPKVVTAGGAAHTKIKQMEQEYDHAAGLVKEQQGRADAVKKQMSDAVAGYVASFRQEIVSFMMELTTKNRFREILALTNAYSSVLGQDAAIVGLGQEALENERAYRESAKIAEAVMAKASPLAVKAPMEASAEIDRSVALIDSKLRDARVKKFVLARLDRERALIDNRIAFGQQKLDARFATIAATMVDDPWEAERMLARVSASDADPDQISQLRAKISAAKQARTATVLKDVHRQLDEAQSYFEKISATFRADIRRGDAQRLTAAMQTTVQRENFVRASSLMKSAEAQLKAINAADLNPEQKADHAGLSASTKECLEVTGKVR